jgi:hypothetical protein
MRPLRLADSDRPKAVLLGLLEQIEWHRFGHLASLWSGVVWRPPL